MPQGLKQTAPEKWNVKISIGSLFVFFPGPRLLSFLIMAEALVVAPVAFGPEPMTLGEDLLQALTAGDAARLTELLSREGQSGGHVAIAVTGAPPGAPPPAEASLAAPAQPPTSSRLLGVTSNGNTALHLAASRGHAEVAALICQRAPSLVATRNWGLDTPLHCAARGGHREVARCLLSTMTAAGEGAEENAAILARNRLGATALYEAVRHNWPRLVDLLMAKAPKLASVTTDDGVSPLYLAAELRSSTMVSLLLRPSPDRTPSPASSGPQGLNALHVAAQYGRDIPQQILNWKPDGPTLLTRVDSSGRTPLHVAIERGRLDVVELFLGENKSIEQAHISDNHGLFPVHIAAMKGNIRIIDELIKKCPDYFELVDHKGRNLLHCAVEHNQVQVVRYLCRNNIFAMLLNAMDYDGNTPLHLAAMYGFPRIVSLLLETRTVKTFLTNKDGLTARDLARLQNTGYGYGLSPVSIVSGCLRLSGGWWTLHGDDELEAREKIIEEQPSGEEVNLLNNGPIGSVLIATVAFAAAFTVPGGFIADDHPGAGTAILAKRFAFRAFGVSNTMAFICSAMATCFFLCGGTALNVSRKFRIWYSFHACSLLGLAAVFTISTFAFGFHLVLGGANHGLIVFVYTMCLATVLFCFPDIWVPLQAGLPKAIWRRTGWRGILNIHRRPSSLLELLTSLAGSFLFPYLGSIFKLQLKKDTLLLH
ncbi:hypothetical protein ACP4OV_018354 [Aristida adscensionis]